MSRGGVEDRANAGFEDAAVVAAESDDMRRLLGAFGIEALETGVIGVAFITVNGRKFAAEEFQRILRAVAAVESPTRGGPRDPMAVWFDRAMKVEPLLVIANLMISRHTWTKRDQPQIEEIRAAVREIVARGCKADEVES